MLSSKCWVPGLGPGALPGSVLLEGGEEGQGLWPGREEDRRERDAGVWSDPGTESLHSENQGQAHV